VSWKPSGARFASSARAAEQTLAKLKRQDASGFSGRVLSARGLGVRLVAIAVAAGTACAVVSSGGCSTKVVYRELPEAGADPSLVFRDPATCQPCHSEHYDEWSGAMHAYAEKDPLFRAIVKVQSVDFSTSPGDFCTQCHTVPGFLRGETIYEKSDGGIYLQKVEGLSPVAEQGVSCDVCHSITHIEDKYNAHVDFEPNGAVRGPFANPVPNEFHASLESPLHRRGEVCTGCHNVLLPAAKPIPLENTGDEWEAYQKGGGTKECQDCHMPEHDGKASNDGPERKVHRHTFVGVDSALLDDFPHRDEQRALTTELLKQAVELDVKLATDTTSGRVTGFSATLKNVAGHAVPSGATTERRMWLEAKLTDAAGALAYQTGQLDANGDLEDEFPEHTLLPKGDPDLWWFGGFVSNTTKDFGRKIVPFPHEATESEFHLLPPLTSQSKDYVLPATLAAGDYELSIRVLYRAIQPYLMRALENHFIVKLDPKLKDKIPTFEMATQTLTFTSK
jgi:hypothetical protein